MPQAPTGGGDARQQHDPAPDFPRALFGIKALSANFYDDNPCQLQTFLTQIPGVTAASVFALTQTAEVRFDMLATDGHAISQAVTFAQLECSITLLETNHPRRPGEYHPQTKSAAAHGPITMVMNCHSCNTEIHHSNESEYMHFLCFFLLLVCMFCTVTFIFLVCFLYCMAILYIYIGDPSGIQRARYGCGWCVRE